MRITAARAMKPSIPVPCRPLLLSLELPTVLFFCRGDVSTSGLVDTCGRCWWSLAADQPLNLLFQVESGLESKVDFVNDH